MSQSRRKFLKQVGWTSIGGVLIPSTLMSSCKKVFLNDFRQFNGNVIIVGAGAAGLYAAYLLKSKGVNVKVIEAANRIGGRMGKNSSFADFPIDIGAQWLHGEKCILGDLVKKQNVEIELDDTDISYWYNNQIVDALPKDIESLLNGGNEDISIKEFAHQQGFDASYDSIVEGIAGDYGADADLMSAQYAFEEERQWSSGDNDYKFKKTFFDLINDFIVPSIEEDIVLGMPINEIDYSGDQIVLTSNDGETYEADKVIVTVPITILQSQSIHFQPAIPSSQKEAIDKIGMGPGMKVFLKFTNQFYPDNILGGPVCAAYANEKIGKTGQDHVLLAFVMGDQAKNLSDLGDDQLIVNRLLEELDEFFEGQASASFIDAFVQDWTKDPYIQGAYSYSKVGIGEARQIAGQNLENKVYFAGEAMNLNGHHQTVHGAVESGYEQAMNILKG